jgi:hypothetical protein
MLAPFLLEATYPYLARVQKGGNGSRQPPGEPPLALSASTQKDGSFHTYLDQLGTVVKVTRFKRSPALLH